MLPQGSIFQYGFFGWGSIQKTTQKVDFLSKKWGFIQEKPQKLDFSHNLGLFSRVGQHWSGYSIHSFIHNYIHYYLELSDMVQLHFQIPLHY